MKFEWNRNKSESNHKKHQIRFEEAQTVFLDPNSIEFFDETHSEDEDRFIRIGLSGRLNLLLVVYCERNDQLIRIISARRAIGEEKKIYEKRI